MKYLIFFFLTIPTILQANDLDIIHLNNYLEKNWVILGAIQNNSEFNYNTISITVRGKRKDGVVIYEHSYPLRLPLPALGKIPFRFDEPLKTHKGIHSIEAEITSARCGILGSFDYSFFDLTLDQRSETYSRVIGMVSDIDPYFEEYVQIALMAYNESGALIYVNFTTPNDILNPYDSSYFSFIINNEIYDTISTYQYVTYGISFPSEELITETGLIAN